MGLDELQEALNAVTGVREAYRRTLTALGDENRKRIRNHFCSPTPNRKEPAMAMTIEEAVHSRHSVRSYTDEPLSAAERAELERVIAEGNAQGNLHMKLVCNDAEAFDSAMAHYGKFSGVKNYIVIAGTPADDLDERGGYWGERVVLTAQQLGLGTCWVAMTFKKRYVKKSVAAGDRLVIVISVGHGTTAGAPHSKCKTPEQVSKSVTVAPDWFKRGIDWVLLAPTAINQQKFAIEFVNGTHNGKQLVSARSLGGPYSKVDLGIVKYHFALGAGEENFVWV